MTSRESFVGDPDNGNKCYVSNSNLGLTTSNAVNMVQQPISNHAQHQALSQSYIASGRDAVVHTSGGVTTPGQVVGTSTEVIDPSQVLSVALDRAQILPSVSHYLQDSNAPALQELQTVQAGLPAGSIISTGQVVQTLDGQMLPGPILSHDGQIVTQQMIQTSLPVHSVQNSDYFSSNSNIMLSFPNSYSEVKEEEVITERPQSTHSSLDGGTFQQSSSLHSTANQISAQVIMSQDSMSNMRLGNGTLRGLSSQTGVQGFIQNDQHQEFFATTSSSSPLLQKTLTDNRTSLSNSSERYIIQVGKLPSPIPTSPTVEVKEDGHLIIRTMGSNAHGSSNRLSESSLSALRAALTCDTKKAEVAPVLISEVPRSSVQNKYTASSSLVPTSSAPKSTPPARYYECTNCGNKFLRSLCLR